jgi:hypothetical protein
MGPRLVAMMVWEWRQALRVILRLCCSLPLRVAGAAFALVLLAAMSASIPWRIQYIDKAGHAVVFEGGVVTAGTIDSTFEWGLGSAPLFSAPGVTPSRARLPLLLMDWGTTAIQPIQESSRYPTGFGQQSESMWKEALAVPLWSPLLGVVLATSFAWGYARRASPPAMRARRVRRILTALGLVLLLGSMLWRFGKHVYVGDHRYFAFPGGGITIGKEVPSVGRYRLRGYGVMLPRYEGPRALEFVGTWSLFIPLWHVGLVCGAAAAWMHGRAKAYQLWRGEWCLRCGYSLLGLTAKTCPECGCEVAVV